MNTKSDTLDQAFIERQRQRLTKLRDALAEAMQGKQAEARDVNAEVRGQAVQYEDDAQRLATLELDGNLVVRNAQRLAQVNRALEKIAEGTYGLSDASKQAIPMQRLEATPESIFTVAEQAARESARGTAFRSRVRVPGLRQREQPGMASQASESRKIALEAEAAAATVARSRTADLLSRQQGCRKECFTGYLTDLCRCCGS